MSATHSEPAADQEPQIIAARREFSVLYQGRALLSLVDPVRQAERLCTALLPAKERTLYLCPSPLFGYGLQEFLAKLPENSALLGVEADAKLYRLTLNHSKLNYDGKHAALVHTKDTRTLCRTVREIWGARYFRRLEELNPGGGRTLHSAFYDEAVECLRREIALDWNNAMTLSRLGRLYIRNLLRNLPRFTQSPRLEQLDFGERPVLLAGAGPSLDQTLDTICRLQAKNQSAPLIIAVDTALGALLDRKLYPALVVVLEAQHWNLGDFTGWGGKALPVAMDMSALYAQAEFAGWQPWFFWTPWTELRFFDRLKAAGLLPAFTMPPLGSVGHSAAMLALRLTRGPVIASGIDFSFTIDNYHTRSSPSHRQVLRQLTRLTSPFHCSAVFRAGVRSAVSKSGLPVRTDPAMCRYRDLFAAEFAPYKHRMFEIEGSGLSLGLASITTEQAVSMLSSGTNDLPLAQDKQNIPPANHRAFLEKEQALLIELRGILTGDIQAGRKTLESLIDQVDYIWAHFPDCAAAGGRRPSADNTSFLKRLRAELDMFIKLLATAASIFL